MNKEEIANQLLLLRKHMIEIASKMNYYGGFDDKWTARAKELTNSAEDVLDWSNNIFDEILDK